MNEDNWKFALARIAGGLLFFAAVVLIAQILSGCVTVGREITGTSQSGETYKYKANVTALIGGKADKLSQALKGELKIYHPDGTLKLSVSLDSSQQGTGIETDSDAFVAGVEFLGRLPIP